MIEGGHVAVILAAGGSRRLGQPKQLLTRGGIPLVCHMVMLSMATMPSQTYVVLGAHEDAMREALAGLPVATLVNHDWHTGLAGSIRCAGQALGRSAGAALMLGTDQWRLTAAHLQSMTDAFDGDHDVVCRYDDTFGIPALVTAGTLARAGELCGDVGLKRLWTESNSTLRYVDAPALADDLDTPAALRRAVASGELDTRNLT
jgi:molybdenum cofactor cytidylyltransferase